MASITLPLSPIVRPTVCPSCGHRRAPSDEPRPPLSRAASSYVGPVPAVPSPVPESTPLILPEPGLTEEPAPKSAPWARVRAAFAALKSKGRHVVKG